jgi:hypothetical protein
MTKQTTQASSAQGASLAEVIANLSWGSIIAENQGRLYTNTRLSKKRAPGGTPAQRTKQPGGSLAAVDKP